MTYIRVLAQSRHNAVTFLGELSNLQKPSFRIANVPHKIWYEHLPNTNPVHFQFSSLLGKLRNIYEQINTKNLLPRICPSVLKTVVEKAFL
jgi:hypothetical protein